MLSAGYSGRTGIDEKMGVNVYGELAAAVFFDAVREVDLEHNFI